MLQEGGIKMTGAKNLADWMQQYDSYEIAHSMETVNEGLAIIARELFDTSQERQALSEYVERDRVLAAKARYMSDMKSALQSIGRGLREV